jgi:putative ABC transport system permease protein
MMFSDLRFALRSLLKTPGFTLVAVLTLALGIGANTALFSVLRAVILQPLPYSEPDRLAYVWMDNPGTQLADDVTSWPMFLHWRKHATSFESMAVYATTTAFNFTGEGEPERLSGTMAGESFLETLGVAPALGRGFTTQEQEPGKDFVVILGHGFWQRRFAGDPAVLGREITINGRPRTIIGVMPPDFFFYEKDDLLIPLAASPELRANARNYHLPVIGRLKSGISAAQAQAELAAAQEAYWNSVPESRGYGVRVTGMHGWQVREVRTALWTLFGAVGCVLLITCTNLANLLLARSLSRRREIAVRLALGASRFMVMRQLLLESLLLAAAGGCAGILLGTWGLAGLKMLGASALPRANLIQVDVTVLVCSLGAALLCGLGFGLLPAWQAGRGDAQTALRDGGRGSSASRGATRTRAALIVAQTALAVVLLVGAGLLLRSFHKLSSVDTGLRGEGLTFMPVALPGAKYNDAVKVAAFQQQALEKLAAAPGVESAALASFIVINRLHSSAIFTLDDRTWGPREPRPELVTDIVSPGYFSTMGIPLVEGRDFRASDTPQSERVVLINEKVARAYWPGRSAVGQRLLLGNLPAPGALDPQGRPITPNWLTIVGVVRDLRRQGPEQPVRLEAYLPSTQVPRPTFRFVVRSSRTTASLASDLRAAIWSIDRDLPLPIIDPVEKTLGAATAQRRLNLWLLGSFAGLALLLAALGLYGVIAWSVNQRTGEFGIRLALGAPPGSLQKLVLGQGVRLVTCGLVAGLAASLALSRIVESLLFGVSGLDFPTYASVCAILGGASLLAAWLPAHRASRVDPLVALRSD